MTIFDINKSTIENEALDELKALIDNNCLNGRTKEYNKIYGKYSELYKNFEKTLTAEQKRKYEEVDSISFDREVQSNSEEFIHGFKIAVRLFIDCLR